MLLNMVRCLTGSRRINNNSKCPHEHFDLNHYWWAANVESLIKKSSFTYIGASVYRSCLFLGEFMYKTVDWDPQPTVDS